MPNTVRHLPPGMYPRLLTVLQAAEYCGVSASTFRDRCTVDPVRDFGRMLYDIQDLDAMIDGWTGKLPPGGGPDGGMSEAEREALRRVTAR